jgi:hypothetical protein
MTSTKRRRWLRCSTVVAGWWQDVEVSNRDTPNHRNLSIWIVVVNPCFWMVLGHKPCSETPIWIHMAGDGLIKWYILVYIQFHRLWFLTFSHPWATLPWAALALQGTQIANGKYWKWWKTLNKTYETFWNHPLLRHTFWAIPLYTTVSMMRQG